MELMQLEMFVAIVEERSFLRAAERVFRTQPAVTIGLQKLEGRVGVPLLDRSSRRGVSLTPAGERLYEYARKILELRDEALSSLKREEGGVAGNIRVGLVGEDSLASIPALSRLFKNQYPTGRLEISSGQLLKVLGELSDGRLDVVLVSGRPRGETQNKGFLITRVRGASGWLWVVRQRLGRSPVAHAFEKCLTESCESRIRSHNLKRVVFRQVSAGKACLREVRVAVEGHGR